MVELSFNGLMETLTNVCDYCGGRYGVICGLLSIIKNKLAGLYGINLAILSFYSKSYIIQ